MIMVEKDIKERREKLKKQAEIKIKEYCQYNTDAYDVECAKLALKAFDAIIDDYHFDVTKSSILDKLNMLFDEDRLPIKYGEPTPETARKDEDGKEITPWYYGRVMESLA